MNFPMFLACLLVSGTSGMFASLFMWRRNERRAQRYEDSTVWRTGIEYHWNDSPQTKAEEHVRPFSVMPSMREPRK